MPKHQDVKGKRKRRTIQSDSDSDSVSDEATRSATTPAYRSTPTLEEVDIEITSEEEDDEDLACQWLLIYGPQTKEEGCELLTQSDLHFDLIDAKYNPLTRCFGVPIENRDRLLEYAQVLKAILTNGLRVSVGYYTSPRNTQSISLTCPDGASPDVSDDEFKRVIDHKYSINLDPDNFRIIFTSPRCWRVLLTDENLTEKLIESANIALAGVQLQINRWRNDLDAPEFPVYVNNISHDVHRKHMRKYFARKCGDEGMTVYWGPGGWAVCRFTTERARQVALALNGRKRFKGELIAVTLPKTREEKEELARKRDKIREEREAKKAEARNRAADQDRRKKNDLQRSTQTTPRRSFTPRWGSSSSSNASTPTHHPTARDGTVTTPLALRTPPQPAVEQEDGEL